MVLRSCEARFAEGETGEDRREAKRSAEGARIAPPERHLRRRHAQATSRRAAEASAPLAGDLTLSRRRCTSLRPFARNLGPITSSLLDRFVLVVGGL
jgi:hypothetical protein